MSDSSIDSTLINNKPDFFSSKVLGHPSGLFVLFFTEMWERFSYYGMRALLILFFTASLAKGGWGWEDGTAFKIFGTYTALVYLSTMLGGYFADNVIGIRKSVVVGAVLMTLGHAAMAAETQFFTYSGLVLLVFGSGFFKPNMTSIVSEMYKDVPEKKDGAYTIFYMGVNAGAFFGILLCGYLGEKVGWSWGFGVAGIFMLFGLLQFLFAQKIFGDIGVKPKGKEARLEAINAEEKLNPFTPFQKALIFIAIAIGLSYVLNDPVAAISEGKYNLFDFTLFGISGPNIVILTGLFIFATLLAIRIPKYTKITRDRMIAILFFAFISMFFFAIFEQSPSSLTKFAEDYTQRSLDGSAALIFKIVDACLTIVPLAIITWVLFLLSRQIIKKYPLSILFLGLSFVIVWGIAIWKVVHQYSEVKTEVASSWFSLLNSLFIITLAPLFSKWWESKYNPNANAKWAIGMTLMGLGMACVAFGAMGIQEGERVSMVWLILVYLFHTMAELCISPVGLSYVSKLVPARMIATMFGIWYLAIAIGNKVAGKFAESSVGIAEEHGISYFFWILTILPIVLAAIAIAVYPAIKKLMHGVK